MLGYYKLRVIMKSNYYDIKNNLFHFGLNLLTTEGDFSGTNALSLVECPKGHKWETRISRIFQKERLNRASKGCPQCAEEIYIQQSYQAALSNLIEGHTILDSFIKKGLKVNTRFYNIQCPYGHVYEKRNPELKNGCPDCSKKTYVGQERTRIIFEGHFLLPFPTVRPEWFKNPVTNKKLELDGYCEELRLAFEYQGRQHSSNDTEFGGDYLHQQERDQYKVDLCREHGIRLIIINQPRSYEAEKFFQSVAKDCREQGLELTITLDDLNFNGINDTNTLVKNYQDFKDFATSKGFQLVTTQFSTMEEPLEFKCQDNHNFQMKGSVFKTILNTDKYRDEPCPECHKKNNPEKVNETITIHSCQELAQSIGYKCLSQSYLNVNTPLEWQCGHGHTLTKTYRQMIRNQTGKYCTQCSELNLSQPKPINTVIAATSKVSKAANGEVLDYNWLTQFALDNGVKLLDNLYKGKDIKHNFKCDKGHEFESTVTNLTDKKKRNTTFCNHAECNGITVIDLSTCENFAKENGLVCLSTQYQNVNEKMDWQCDKGHNFQKSYRQFLRSKTGRYCPQC